MKSQFSIFKQSKGFTLIELIVVISIIGLLSGILFLGKTSGERRLALQRSAYQLSQDLREVQEMAMGAKETKCGTHNFGIYLKQGSGQNSYILFGDCNANCHFDDSSSDEVLREVKLEKDVVYSLPSDLHIIFVPPDPEIYINSTDCLNDWGEETSVTLSLNSETKTVKINSAGRIEIE